MITGVQQNCVRAGDLRHRGSAAEPQAALHTLSTMQRRVFDIIVQYHEATGEPCSARLIARRLTLHHSTVQDHLAALWRKGWVLTPNAPARPRPSE